MSSFDRSAFLETFHTGVAVPVTSLFSEKSQGCGDFRDLEHFGKWCASVGIDVIQLLPVNDTGGMSSPYSALSAFALNPIYYDLHELDLDDLENLADEINGFSQDAIALGKVDYLRTLAFKDEILRKVFASKVEELRNSQILQFWISSNSWIESYAAYLILKKENRDLPWFEWQERQKVFSDSLIRSVLESNKDQFLYYAWVQFGLDVQLARCKGRLEKIGVHLKGDIPILMNDDSADVWQYPDLFDMSKRAGAPPDMFALTGQHWGFPTYNWPEMKRQKFDWWIRRLKHAERFYQLYRIDHVLGFFRIWSIPASELTGTLGVFDPIMHPSKMDLQNLGIGKDQLTKLTKAQGKEIERSWSGDDSELSEASIEMMDLSESEKEAMNRFHRNRTLLDLGNEHFAFTWYYEDSQAFQDLEAPLAQALVALKTDLDKSSELVWEKQGRELLTVIRDATSMLPCAEDLGVVPDCVPKVLEDLEILSLKIERWITESKDKKTLSHPETYPFYSVSVTSVHDTSTLRGWWFELDKELKSVYNEQLGLENPASKELSPEMATLFLRRHMEANSVLISIPIQDFLSIRSEYHQVEAKDERINVPGIVDQINWSYRIPVSLENLERDSILSSMIAKLLISRRAEKVSC